MLNYNEYLDKVQGCFLGKNIGGTLGAPFECIRGYFNVEFYTQDLQGKAVPNDDLDLQLIWLNAAERFKTEIDSAILGEYWLNFITPHWSEYGAAKNNMRMGLCPPYSAFVNNLNRDSCGAFIRSEIWACLAPAHPRTAVRYAYRDAIVDHCEEGVYGEIFFAALESAAFVISDILRLIEIGLSYIPETSAVYRAVRLVLECFKNKDEVKTVRKKILIAFPAHFGMLVGYQDREPEQDIPIGRLGYDAPANVALAVLGLVYGEGDFGKSICICASCGEDGDCTCATAAAVLGIITGAKGLPEKWLEPIGEDIATVSLNRGDRDCVIPKTVTELSERIGKLMPEFLEILYGNEIPYGDENELYCGGKKWGQNPFEIIYTFPLIDVAIDLKAPPIMKDGGKFNIEMRLENKFFAQQWITIGFITSDGFIIGEGQERLISLEHWAGNVGVRTLYFTLYLPETLQKNREDIIIYFYFNGRHTKYFIPLTLLKTDEVDENEPT